MGKSLLLNVFGFTLGYVFILVISQPFALMWYWYSSDAASSSSWPRNKLPAATRCAHDREHNYYVVLVRRIVILHPILRISFLSTCTLYCSTLFEQAAPNVHTPHVRPYFLTTTFSYRTIFPVATWATWSLANFTHCFGLAVLFLISGHAILLNRTLKRYSGESSHDVLLAMMKVSPS